jgi:hypothetical protein
MRNHLRLTQAFLLILIASATAFADVKIKSRQTTQGQTYEGTTYIKAKRQRTESMNGQMVMIQQCDLRRDLQLMPASKMYTVNPYDEAGAASSSSGGATRTSASTTTTTTTRGGLVTTTVTARDTGERKQMFGYNARHIITTIETVSSPDACTPVKSKMMQDGWYIDATFQLNCDAGRGSRYYQPAPKQGGCQDRYQVKQVGAARTGYPVWERMTMYGPDGAESFSMLNEVVDISQATLDAALFEAPADYRQVSDFSGASLADGMSGANNADDDEDDARANNETGTSANARHTATGGEAASTLGAKRAGIVRLGLVTVKTGAVGDSLDASELSAAVGNTLGQYLKAPHLEVVRIEAGLPAQVDAEARQKECDFVIYANVSHKKGGGGFGGMFGKVAPALGSIAAVGVGGASGGGAGHSAPTGSHTAASISASVKAKDEISLEVKMQTPDSTAPVVSKQLKAKAKSNGEDIITPLVEQVAQAITDATANR